MEETLQQSPLAAEHLALGARMVPFAGWEMPIQYESVMSEHQTVRSSCGVFDISHMGQLWVSGPRAEVALNALLTNDVSTLSPGEGQYSLMLNEQGGVIDDLILYRTGVEEYFLVVNASRVDEDVDWLLTHLGVEVTLENVSSVTGGMAIQGPESVSVWTTMSDGVQPLPERNGFGRCQVEGREAILCRTGYTGEDGFELFAPVDEIAYWWRRTLENGALPCGLGSRDTLRLEKGFPLNGSDLDADHTPLEAGLGFFVKLGKPGAFTARDRLALQRDNGLPTQLITVRPTGKCPPPRAGYGICLPGGESIGELTSGTLSPTLGAGIGMGYARTGEIDLTPGTEIELEIRGRRYPAAIVKKPFV